MNRAAIDRTITALRRNRISAQFIDNPADIISVINSFLSPGMTIGIGDSQTLAELSIYQFLENSNIQYLNKYKSGLSKEEKKKIYSDNFSADLFISGVNAVTTGGKIFNLDGNGSRVAPIIYGPKKVLLICGINKIVESDEDAVERIKNRAAPMDAKRLNKKTPCAVTGKCMNCKSADRICNYYTIIQGQFDESRITVLFVNGTYGY